jgi:DNA-binding HxlR family transcriptional regulator
VPTKSTAKHRSGCPVSVSLDIIGDRWSLIIVRDLMVRGYRTFHQFQNAGEGIATNLLSDRLQKLGTAGILGAEPVEGDARSSHYRLTAKGIALAPVLLELLIWAGHHEDTAAACNFIEHLVQNRQAVLAEAYCRWEQRDPRPLIPPFISPAKSSKGKTRR